MSNSFFMDFTFSDNVSGFRVSCHAAKIYEIEFFECVDRMLDDAMKILRKDDAQVTFQLFTGYETIDLLRICRTFDGKLDAVIWKYNSYGYAYETRLERDNKLTRKTVKDYAVRAMELFRARESA